MLVGVPCEIKNNENRVSVVPAGVYELTRRGHQVKVQAGAGLGSGVTDQEYIDAGATMVQSAEEAWDCPMVVKVKEPIASEYDKMKADQLVFTYFHFAADETLTKAVIDSKCHAIAYETVRFDNGELPLLTPMSEVAGRMAVQEGAKYLEKPMMGRGILLGGVPGVEPAEVVILGGGVVGSNAAKIAAGLGAHVTLLDINLSRLRYLSEIMPANVQFVHSNAYNIEHYVKQADLLIGAVLIEGAKAPTLVDRAMISTMKAGSVIVDVAVDQGGCIETCKPTTHKDPTFIIDDVVHYCVANMPGAVGRTSTYALTNATTPYMLRLADLGFDALKEDPCLALGLNISQGRVTNQAVADTFNLEAHPITF